MAARPWLALEGAGGLGGLSSRYGHQRFHTIVLVAVIVMLIELFSLVQVAGSFWIKRLKAKVKSRGQVDQVSELVYKVKNKNQGDADGWVVF